MSVSTDYNERVEDDLNRLTRALRHIQSAKQLVKGVEPNSDEIIEEYLNLTFYGLVSVTLNLSSVFDILILTRTDV